MHLQFAHGDTLKAAVYRLRANVFPRRASHTAAPSVHTRITTAQVALSVFKDNNSEKLCCLLAK